MKKNLIVFMLLCAVISLACAKEKKSKNKANQNIVEEVSDYIENIDVEVITREQIDSMFALASQLNVDLKTAIANKNPEMAEELDYLIAAENAELDKLIPELKKSSEWTLSDDEELKKISAEYKKLTRKYKPSK